MSTAQQVAPSTLALRGVLGSLATLAVLLLLAPTVVVIVVSFTNGYSLKFPPPGYSLRWYAALGDAWQLQFAALNSLKVATAATLLSVLLGVPAAMAMAAGTPSSTDNAVAPSATFRLLSAANCSCQASPSASYQRSE